VRDPYEILGVARGASFDEIKVAYRRACKSKHPDMGGSDAEFIELRNAYDHVLNDLKHGYQQQREAPPRPDDEWHEAKGTGEQSAPRWEDVYRDINDELEELRRAADMHEEALRSMREGAWAAGENRAWARFVWDDFVRFTQTIIRSGLKGLSLVVAALIGIGSILIQANVVSAILIIGAGTGILISLAFRNDKGGIISAGLLLFGIMTIWLPPVRAALFGYPLATISVLICLALIFKFVQAGGTVGLMTGGVLALYLISVILGGTQQHDQQASLRQPSPQDSNLPRSPPAQPPTPVAPQSTVQSSALKDERNEPAPVTPAMTPSASSPSRSAPAPAQLSPPQQPAPEARTLLAAKGAVLRFAAGVPYQLKIRSGFTTSLRASQGLIAFHSGNDRVGECTDRIELTMRPGGSPYQDIAHMIRACGTDAIAQVVEVR
jgi:hypothetical protein